VRDNLEIERNLERERDKRVIGLEIPHLDESRLGNKKLVVGKVLPCLTVGVDVLVQSLSVLKLERSENSVPLFIVRDVFYKP